jgi:hypothetical protein
MNDNTATADWLTELLECRNGALCLSGGDFDDHNTQWLIYFVQIEYLLISLAYLVYQ